MRVEQQRDSFSSKLQAIPAMYPDQLTSAVRVKLHSEFQHNFGRAGLLEPKLPSKWAVLEGCQHTSLRGLSPAQFELKNN